MAETVNLWETIGDLCLKRAEEILDRNDAYMTKGTAEAVRALVETAISIEDRDFWRAESDQSGAAGSPVQLGEQESAKDATPEQSLKHVTQLLIDLADNIAASQDRISWVADGEKADRIANIARALADLDRSNRGAR